jgi:hypothetical protein
VIGCTEKTGLCAANQATAHYQPGPNGLGFRDNKIYSFSSLRLVVLRGGEEPATWVKLAEGQGRAGWFSSRKLADLEFGQILNHYIYRSAVIPVALEGDCPVLQNGQLLFPFYRRFCGRDLTVGRFVSLIPPRILPLLTLFHEGRWQLYSFLARCGDEARELAESHLPLAYALAHAKAFHPVARPLRSARSLVKKKRRDILAWLGFPNTASTVRLLGRLDPSSMSVQRLLRLRWILNGNDERVTRLLRHVPRIHAEHIDSLAFLRDTLTPRLMAEMSDRGTAAMALGWLNRLSRAVRELEEPLPPVSDMEHLENLIERKERELCNHALCQHLPNEFPSPPVLPQENAGIEPIQTLPELIAEGESQHNCCVNYALRVLKGTYYLYRVLRPVRATFSLRLLKNGAWVPDQLLEARNQPVSPLVRQHVLEGLFPETTESMSEHLADDPLGDVPF